jgi:hypothetical protein
LIQFFSVLLKNFLKKQKNKIRRLKMARSFNPDNQDYDFLSFFEDDERVNRNDPRRKKYVNLNEIPDDEESDDDKMLYDLLYDLFYDLNDQDDDEYEGGLIDDLKFVNDDGFDGFDDYNDYLYPKFEPFSRMVQRKFRW